MKLTVIYTVALLSLCSVLAAPQANVEGTTLPAGDHFLSNSTLTKQLGAEPDILPNYKLHTMLEKRAGQTCPASAPLACNDSPTQCCPSQYPQCCVAYNWCCSSAAASCCNVSGRKYCCPSGYPYCDPATLRCYPR